MGPGGRRRPKASPGGSVRACDGWKRGERYPAGRPGQPQGCGIAGEGSGPGCGVGGAGRSRIVKTPTSPEGDVAAWVAAGRRPAGPLAEGAGFEPAVGY